MYGYSITIDAGLKHSSQNLAGFQKAMVAVGGGKLVHAFEWELTVCDSGILLLWSRENVFPLRRWQHSGDLGADRYSGATWTPRKGLVTWHILSIAFL